MKRFAAHYLFVPGSGFLKQYAIEIEGGYICYIFPFSEEIESVEWFPGVIPVSYTHLTLPTKLEV